MNLFKRAYTNFYKTCVRNYYSCGVNAPKITLELSFMRFEYLVKDILLQCVILISQPNSLEGWFDIEGDFRKRLLLTVLNDILRKTVMCWFRMVWRRWLGILFQNLLL